jgi:hypothetical protein
VKYTIEQWGFRNNTHMKRKSHKSRQIRFFHKHPGAQFPASSMIFEMVEGVHSTGSFSDNKYTRQVKFDETGARL